MSDDRVRATRMRSQLLDGRAGGVVDAVRHVVGIQAQEPRAAALSIRARTEGLTIADVERTIADERSVVRIWAMRGTLHLVTAEDSGWLHDLFAPGLLRAEERTLDRMGVTEPERRKATDAIVRALGGGPLTRAEVCERLEAAGIDASGRRAAHLPALAALQGRICFGPRQGAKDTYVLIDDWLGPRRRLERDAALRELARRYAAAFGPAEPEDLAAWSGCGLREARAAWTGAGTGLADPSDPPMVRLLPAFDTYLLGYRSRELAVPAEHADRVWPGGGIIRPTIIENGLVVGTWSLRGRRLDVELFAGAPDTAAEEEDVLRFIGSAGAGS